MVDLCMGELLGVTEGGLCVRPVGREFEWDLVYRRPVGQGTDS